MRLPITITSLALTAALGVATISPAKADGAATTRNIILGAAVLVAGVAIESNVAHKNRLASTVQGYLPDGGVVYGDGRVVEPNGQTYYPGNNGQQVACNGQYCSISQNTANNGQYGAYGNGGNGGYGSYGNNGYGNYSGFAQRRRSH